MHLRGFPHRLNLRPAIFLAGATLPHGPLWRGYDRAALAARLACPLLVLHGVDDELCPIEDGWAIAAAAPLGSIVELPDCGHLDAWVDEGCRERAVDAVRGFMAGLATPEQPGK